MRFKSFMAVFILTSLFTACQKDAQIKKRTFGQLKDGRPVTLYTLENKVGMQVGIMDYGATVVSIKTADNMGQITEVTLGFDSLAQYLNQSPYFGAVVGRYANRIAGGRFTLFAQEYQLATNNGPNHLHGGVRGFDKVMWKAQPGVSEEGQFITFRYTSPDGEEGYPGTVAVSVTYTLMQGNTLQIHYEATTSKPTIINLSNHTYFNLKDAGRTDILGHYLKINADRYTPVDETLIPTGELAPVEDTPFDFQEPHKIGEFMHPDHPQIAIAGGYDHNFVLIGQKGSMKLAAAVFEPTTGRILNVATTEPGLQFYSGNFLDGLKGRGGVIYNKHAGFCLETQHFPDSPNHPNFPSVTLKPGEKYESTTIYKFLLKFVELDQ